jgi:hypothetical protein
MNQCPICNGYDHNHFLTTHKHSPLGDTTVRQYYCNTCSHRFDTEEKLLEVEVTPDDMKSAFNHILKQLEETKEELNRLKSTLPTTLTGWYSQTAANQFGTVIYSDHENREVEVTNVTRTNGDEYKWPDKICVGPVKCYLNRDLG